MTRFAWGWVFLVMVAGCVTERYVFKAKPSYARLPRVNLDVATHQAVGYDVTTRDFRYALETALAEKRVAAVADTFDSGLQQVLVELVDRGGLPAPDTWEDRDSWGDGDRLVDVTVGLRDGAGQRIVAGQVHGIIGYDIASTTKTAEVTAALVERALLGAPAPAE